MKFVRDPEASRAALIGAWCDPYSTHRPSEPLLR
jgi:hypothetical protein